MKAERRFVFDTNAVVSAVLFERSLPGKAFYAALDEGAVLLSQATLAELREVLARPKFDKYASREDREAFLAMLLGDATLVDIVEEVLACRDPKDDKFLELAVNGTASCIVTGDRDLLALNPFRGVSILTPVEFLDWRS